MPKQNVLKLIIFSDLHYLDQNHSEQYNRKLTHLAIPLLEHLTSKINDEIRPDACIYLGDLIEDTNNHDRDIKNLKYIFRKLQEIEVPLYVVPGNHDLRSMDSRKEWEAISETGSATFSVDLKGYHLVFLGLDVRNNLGNDEGGILKTQYISEADLEWLKKDLQSNKKTCLLFHHYGIANDDMTDNWWFADCPRNALLVNRNEVKEIIEKEGVIGVFSGHQHWTKRLFEQGINYFVVGSISENSNGNGVPDGIYLEVELGDKTVNVVEKHIELI